MYISLICFSLSYLFFQRQTEKAKVLYFLNDFQKPGLLWKPFGFLFHWLQHSLTVLLAICLIFAYIT